MGSDFWTQSSDTFPKKNGSGIASHLANATIQPIQFESAENALPLATDTTIQARLLFRPIGQSQLESTLELVLLEFPVRGIILNLPRPSVIDFL